jgi:anhydro-N-acetylmuramic acid kinase
MAGEKHLVVGLMSGTSADAVDAALIETDGEALVRPIAWTERPYRPEEKDAIRAAARAALAMAGPAPDPVIAEAERVMTLAHAEAVAGLSGSDGATLIGFHGATVAHRPARGGGWTWQIGDAALLAQLTGRPVVHDFRGADVAAGGEGAPLAPGYHRALAAASGIDEAIGVLNLGGVGNLTWIADGQWGAFDTGPGNALLDDWITLHGLGDCDRDGAVSARGHVNDGVLAAMTDLPWFHQAGPKSLDRDDFSLAPVRGLAPADGAATLAAFTAESVRLALALLPAPLSRLLVTGGGRHNPTIMAMLEQRTGLPVAPVEAVGWRGDSLEAEAFAWLAVRHLRGLPLSWPETTGVPRPLTGGRRALP